MSINRFITMGYLGADPEVRYTPDGRPVVEVRIATNNSYRDRAGELKQFTEWHRLVAFDKLGEQIASHCVKGDKAYFESYHRTRKFVDPSTKQERYSDEFVITFADFMSKKGVKVQNDQDDHAGATGAGDGYDFPPI